MLKEIKNVCWFEVNCLSCWCKVVLVEKVLFTQKERIEVCEMVFTFKELNTYNFTFSYSVMCLFICIKLLYLNIHFRFKVVIWYLRAYLSYFLKFSGKLMSRLRKVFYHFVVYLFTDWIVCQMLCLKTHCFFHL